MTQNVAIEEMQNENVDPLFLIWKAVGFKSWVRRSLCISYGDNIACLLLR